MNSIVKYSCEALAGAVVNCIVENGEPWFKAADVASALKYVKTDKAIRDHVSEDDKRTQGSLISNPPKSGGLTGDSKNANPCESPGLKGNWKNAIYINESGLYCLIFGSAMEEAKVFKHWVTREVLPQIRKTGSYKSRYDYWRNEAELGLTSQRRWKEVKKIGRAHV